MFYTQTGNIYQVKEWKIPFCSDLSDDTCNKLSDCLFYYYLRPKRKFFFVSSVGMYTYTWDARLSFSRRRKQETERWRFLIIAKESSHRVPSFSPLRGCAHTFKSLIAWKKRRRVALAFECTHTHTQLVFFSLLFFFSFLGCLVVVVVVVVSTGYAITDNNATDWQVPSRATKESKFHKILQAFRLRTDVYFDSILLPLLSHKINQDSSLFFYIKKKERN